MCGIGSHTAMLSVGCVGTFVSVFGTTSIELWILRAIWLVLPFTAGPTFAAALEDRDDPFRTGVSVLLWVVWAAMLVSLMVPRAQTLTVLRIIPLAGMIAMVWAALAANSSVGAGLVVLGVVTVVVAALLSLRSPIGDTFVDGSSYGDERRFLLGTPGPLLLGPLAIVWALLVLGAVAGPLLLLAERWIIGAVALVVGWALTWYTIPILHRLSNRWLVFVPAGMVVHDKTALREPQLFRVEDIEAFGPAPADSEQTDLSLEALGLALRVELTGESKIIRNARAESLDLVPIDGFIVSPNRPGAVVEEARKRGYPIG